MIAESKFKKIEIGVSSMVDLMLYNEEDKEMIVAFKKGGGFYSNVEKETAEIFEVEGEKIDGSVGKLIHSVFRANPGKWPWKPLNPAELVEKMSGAPVSQTEAS